MQEVKATFHSVIQLMDEFPEWKFTSTSTAFFSWIEAVDPHLFLQIQKRVEEGRWEIAGGWFIECDCILPGGESFIRQALIGQHYLHSRFGMNSKIGSNIDSFGHTNTLPMLLRGCGMTHYVFMRPPLEDSRFIWKAPDGSTVEVLHLPGEYTTWSKAAMLENIERTQSAMQQAVNLPVCYGVGNHGGGPTKENIKAVFSLKATNSAVQFSNYSQFFASASTETALKHKSGAYDTINSGCWTNDNPYKLENRVVEQMLIESECLETLKEIRTSIPYRHENLENIWKRLLFNQFHDLLCGTAIKTARDEALRELMAARADALRFSSLAIQQLIQGIDTDGPGFPLFLFNTKGFSYEGVIEVELSWFCRDSLMILDENNLSVPYQQIHTACKATHLSIGGRRNIVFQVKLPAVGFVQYRAIKGESSAAFLPPEPIQAKSYILDNSLVSARIDSKTGLITSLKELTSNYESLNQPIRYEIWIDERDSWGHPQGGRYEPTDETLQMKSMCYSERGPIRTVIKTEFTAQGISLTRYCTLERGSKQVKLEHELVWDRPWCMLRMIVPTKEGSSHIRCETSHGFIERTCEDGRDYMMHRWLDIDGMMIANSNTHAFSIIDHRISLIILRSPIHAQMRGNWEYTGTDRYDWANLGQHSFAFLLRPHSDPIPMKDCFEASECLASPPQYVLDCIHGGIEDVRWYSLVSLTAEEVHLVLVKQARDRKGMIVRLLETGGSTTQGMITVKENKYPFSITAYELKTFLIDESTQSIQIVNYLEEPNEKLS
jgi:alpha-mannosidase